MNQAQGNAQASILPWISFTVSEADLNAQTSECMERAAFQHHTTFCLQAKYRMPRRRRKARRDTRTATQIISSYPKGAELLCQKLASYEPEVEFLRQRSKHRKSPDSLDALKTLPRVVGDGASLWAIDGQDPRAES